MRTRLSGANLERHQSDTRRLLDERRPIAASVRRELDEQRKAAESRGEAFKYDRGASVCPPTKSRVACRAACRT